MQGMLLGLLLGAILCVGVSLAVHKMMEYGKAHGIVKLDRDKKD